MATRKHVPTPTRNIPAGPTQWNTLLSKVIQRAVQLRDPRLPGLRKAMGDGKAEKALRQLGILSDVDLDREFPVNG